MMVHHDSFGFNAHENIISVYELHCSERVFLLYSRWYLRRVKFVKLLYFILCEWVCLTCAHYLLHNMCMVQMKLQKF